ncbi:hypothetical protein KCP78_21345 [Salmonella enterica subsp. enterica]|nr:hypothetical protein KCP78_21345 [Salmonella enterica subsp. enterica]
MKPRYDIHISSTDAKVYIPTGQQVTVLIDYCGSVFAEPENTVDATVQKTTNPDFRHRYCSANKDAINALDRLRRSLALNFLTAIVRLAGKFR